MNLTLIIKINMKPYNQIKIENRAWDAILQVKNAHKSIYQYSLEEAKRDAEIYPTLQSDFIVKAIAMVNYAKNELNAKGVTHTDDLTLIIAQLESMMPSPEKEAEKKAAEYRRWLAEYEANRPDGCVYSDMAQNGE
jgi:hypothetical protein